MGRDAIRTTIAFKPKLHRMLRLKAFETSRSITDLVNQAVTESFLEDGEDTGKFAEQRDEAQISYDKMVAQLKRDGAI